MSPLIRRVYRISTSRVFTLPKSWLEYIEAETGHEVKEVAIEIDNVLTISPVLPAGLHCVKTVKGKAAQ